MRLVAFRMANIIYWAFQLINGLTALAMVLAPKRFHESMFKNPSEVYVQLGFSETAVEMLHNVLRGQGSVLLAITCTLLYSGPGARTTFLLISLTCGLSLVAHIVTTQHHRKDPKVMAALGNMKAMIPILVVNLVFAIAGMIVFLWG